MQKKIHQQNGKPMASGFEDCNMQHCLKNRELMALNIHWNLWEPAPYPYGYIHAERW